MSEADVREATKTTLPAADTPSASTPAAGIPVHTPAASTTENPTANAVENPTANATESPTTATVENPTTATANSPVTGAADTRDPAFDIDELVFVHAGFGTAAVPYEAGWELQRRAHAKRADGEISDTVLLLEHQPVYTAGKRTGPMDRPFGDPGAPVVDVDRGGKITWHGPGQLTGYPILRLPDPVDVVAYVRLLERMMMAVCAELGLPTVTVEGRSGLWVSGSPNGPDRKIGSIGIRVSRGVTMHGFMLNCDCDLEWFDRIVPCGISDAESTSLSRELGRPVSVAEITPLVERHLAEALGAAESLHRTTVQVGV